MLTPPPSKSRRCNTTTALRDKTNDVVGHEESNGIRQLLQDMSEEVGADVTGSFILSKVAELLKLALSQRMIFDKP